MLSYEYCLKYVQQTSTLQHVPYQIHHQIVVSLHPHHPVDDTHPHLLPFWGVDTHHHGDGDHWEVLHVEVGGPFGGSKVQVRPGCASIHGDILQR